MANGTATAADTIPPTTSPRRLENQSGMQFNGTPKSKKPGCVPPNALLFKARILAFFSSYRKDRSRTEAATRRR
jgi:hypothetical protein